MKNIARKQKDIPNGTYNALFLNLVDCKDGHFRLRFMVWAPDLNEGRGETECFATNKKFLLSDIINFQFGGRTPEQMSRSQWEVVIGDNPQRLGVKTIVDFQPNKWVMDRSFVNFMETWQGEGMNGAQGGLTPERRNYLKQKLASDPKYARTQKIRKVFQAAIAGNAPDAICQTLTGLPHKQLLDHLKSTIKDPSIDFEDPTTYQIDHIRPLKDFDVFTREEICKANHYTNLQVLTPQQNRVKYCNQDENPN